MPDLQAVVAMVYMGDYFHNWDFSLFGPVYAITHGLMPCIDVDVPYGFGASVMLAKMLNIMGGFGYAKLLGIVMWLGCIYFILWFLLLRQFLSSSLLGFAAIVCAMRIHMFSWMTGYIVWVPMMSSFYRYCFDVGLFWVLWKHLQTRRMFFLAAGAFFVSLSLYHMAADRDLCVFRIWAVCLCFAFVPCLGGKRDPVLWRNHALILGSVAVWTGLWFYFSVGAYLWQGVFFKNLVGNGSLYVKGVMSGSLASSITSNNLMSGVGGFVYPVFCLSSFLYAAGKVINGKVERDDVFAGLLATLRAGLTYLLYIDGQCVV